MKASQVNAVIAPNMAQPIVSLQTFMQNFADTHGNQFEGYSLGIVESHQNGKADTSGTAKAMVQYFNKMGIPFMVNQIVMIRKPDEQRRLGVSEEHLSGHGWHSYYIQAPSQNRINPLEEFQDLFYNQFFSGNPSLREYKISRDDSFTKAVAPDGNVTIMMEYDGKGHLTLTHNINGRSVYADGTMNALRFLRNRTKAADKGKSYSMIDVLKSEKEELLL